MNRLDEEGRAPTAGPRARWRATLHEVIFEADTPAGKGFDVLLIGSILLSAAAVMLDSVGAVRAFYGRLLYGIEWFFTLLFTVEYLLRLLCVGRPAKYATSFFGVVDLLAIAPTYLSLILPGSQYLLVIRILRILRIFRIFKLVQYLGEAKQLMQALRASRCGFRTHPATDSAAKWATRSGANWARHSAVKWTTDSAPNWATFFT